MEKHCIKTKKSFTLAEVLITLTIIGVIASMTIPGMMQNSQNAEITNKVLKTYSTISQATQMIKTENGGTLAGIFLGHSTMRNLYKSKIVGVKECSSIDADCWHADDEFYDLDGDVWNETYYNDDGNLIGNDNVLYQFALRDPDCNYENHGDGQNEIFNHSCGLITVDVNGFKKPNRMGVDIHRFFVLRDGVYPFGSDGSNTSLKTCDMSSNSNSNGYGCTAILIRTKAMDYYKK